MAPWTLLTAVAGDHSVLGSSWSALQLCGCKMVQRIDALRRATLFVSPEAAFVAIAICILAAPPAYGLDVSAVPTGWSVQTFTDRGGMKHDFSLFLPHRRVADAKLPVIMFLNGRGQNGTDGITVRNNFGLPVWEMQDFFPFLAIAPQCRVDERWTGRNADSTWAMDILSEVVAKFEADEDRLYLTGVSAGGSGVWELASANPGVFAAIAPLCGNGGRHEVLAEANIPIWNFINSGDSEDLVAQSREARERLLSLGSSPLFTEFDRSGHDCWNVTYRMPALYAWLLRHRRSDRSRSIRYRSIPSSELLAKWTTAGDWRAVDSNAIKSAAGGETSLVSPVLKSECELHTDVRVGAGGAVSLSLLTSSAAGHIEVCRVSLEPGLPGSAHMDVQPEFKVTSPLSMSAASTFRPDRWNDVRLAVLDGSFEIHVNGWRAGSVSFEQLEQMQEHEFRIALGNSSDGHDSEWRFVRMSHRSDLEDDQ